MGKAEQGSVLMEFMLVIPLYLCLFGACLLIGELALGRIKLWNNDRMLAWLASDRRVAHVKSKRQAFNHPLRELAKEALYFPDLDAGRNGWSFEDTRIDESEWVGETENSAQMAVQNGTGQDVFIIANKWNTLYNAQMQLKLNKIPAWIRGFLMMGHFFSKAPSPFAEASYDFYQGGIGEDDRPSDRHYVIRRIPEHEPDCNSKECNKPKFHYPEYNRNASANELATGFIVWNVVSDLWPSKEAVAVGQINTPDTYPDPDHTEYKRGLALWGE